MSNSRYLRVKHVLDVLIIIFSLPIIIFLSIIVALSILIFTKDPVLFMQRRTGKDNKEFIMYKFRTMKQKVSYKRSIKEANELTCLGRFLRKTHLDELPQVVNILKGEMCFIGPRPERPELIVEIEKEVPNFRKRHVVKPGITGWAQVQQGYTYSVEEAKEKLNYDLYYIDNVSFSLDLLILIKTIKTIFTSLFED